MGVTSHSNAVQADEPRLLADGDPEITGTSVMDAEFRGFAIQQLPSGECAVWTMPDRQLVGALK
jgi:hypothetical protein